MSATTSRRAPTAKRDNRLNEPRLTQTPRNAQRSTRDTQLNEKGKAKAKPNQQPIFPKEKERQEKQHGKQKSQVEQGKTRSNSNDPRPTDKEALRWATSDRLVFDRTLNLYSVSPLHFSSLPGSVRTISKHLFLLLQTEIHHHVNMRLSEGLGFLEGVGTMATNRDAETGDLRPPTKRRRTDLGKVGKVRVGFVQDPDFVQGLTWTLNDQTREEVARPWAIEIEMGVAAEVLSSKAKAAQTEANATELCQILFIPSCLESKTSERSWHHFPLIATKTPTVSLASDEFGVATNNIGREVLSHALDWIQKRFDCRISSGTGAMSVASVLRGSALELLAELIVHQTRLQMQGKPRTVQKKIHHVMKPVELCFSLPTLVSDPCSTGNPDHQIPGPAPELSTLTLTVPWPICMQLLDGLDLDQPLLVALNHYLSFHTSIPLDALELVRIGVAGVNIGVGAGMVKIKMTALPDEQSLDQATNKRTKGKDLTNLDRKRAGRIIGLIRDVVEEKTIQK